MHGFRSIGAVWWSEHTGFGAHWVCMVLSAVRLGDWCDPAAATSVFLGDAERQGADVLFGCKVVGPHSCCELSRGVWPISAGCHAWV